jgi:ABC-type sugar transport system ATPase subunit
MITQEKRPLVSLQGLCKSFPGVRALANVNLQVHEGEVLCIVGKNGAGKSTLVRILMGLQQPDSGKIEVNGKAFARMSASDAIAEGIAYVPQHVSLMGALSVGENILAGALPRNRLGLVQWQKVYTEAEKRLEKLRLEIDVRKNVEGITFAERTMLAIAQALFKNAKIIILDEPTAALPRPDIERLFGLVRSLRDTGVAVIFISHHLEEVFEICNRVMVLRDGQAVGTYNIADLDMGRLVNLIVGENLNEYVRARTSVEVSAALEIRGLTRRGCFEDLNITLAKGEVVGLSGLQGSGASSLAAALVGLERRGQGEVRVNGKFYNARNPGEAFAQGVALLPQDRSRFGLVDMRPIRENITYTILNKLTGFLGFIRSSQEREIAESYIEKLGIATPSQEKQVKSLSGGNQQKVVFAKLAATKPSVLLLNDPTQGIDVRAKLDIYKVIDDLSAQGIAILIVSSEVRELVGVCDRILVMYEGRITNEFRRGDRRTTPSNILLAIEGGHDHASR